MPKKFQLLVNGFRNTFSSGVKNLFGTKTTTPQSLPGSPKKPPLISQGLHATIDVGMNQAEARRNTCYCFWFCPANHAIVGAYPCPVNPEGTPVTSTSTRQVPRTPPKPPNYPCFDSQGRQGTWSFMCRNL